MDDNCHGFLGVESQDRKEGHEWGGKNIYYVFIIYVGH